MVLVPSATGGCRPHRKVDTAHINGKMLTQMDLLRVGSERFPRVGKILICVTM